MGESTYYVNPRPELAALIPDDAHVILDVGCGAGRLGAALKLARSDRRVTGIEFRPEVAAEARQVLDAVLVGDVTVMNLPFRPGEFDVIICADILEHLPDPAAVLARLRSFLRPGGKLITSIPNMRHYTVILRLVTRGWVYDDEGHFDRTHFRFFSRSTMVELLSTSGYRAITAAPRIVASRKMRSLNWILGGRLEEFVAFQYLLTATRD